MHTPPPMSEDAGRQAACHGMPSWDDGNPLAGHPRYMKLRHLNRCHSQKCPKLVQRIHLYPRQPCVTSDSRFTKSEEVSHQLRGASGFVQLALDTRTQEQIAIKFIEREGNASQRIIARELLNHRECAMHPHIIQLREVFMTPHHLAVAMEYAPGGDLSEYVDACKRSGLSCVPEPDARWIFQQFVIAVDYCHRLGIASRDVKLDNVLLDGSLPLPIIKICDFGYSKDEVAGSVCKTACGTPEYMAPEVLTTEVYDGKAADIWSCGVMLYVMLLGSFPFRRPEDDRVKGVRQMQLMFSRIISADYLLPPHVSVACQDLLRGMLTVEPSKRISIQGIAAHPWFLKDLPPGSLQMNARLQASDNCSFGSCLQSTQDILDLVNACNEEMGKAQP